MTFFQNIGLSDFDIAIILLTLFSMFIGFVRGFSKEILGIVKWVGAVLLSLHLKPYVLPFVKKYITSTFFCEPITIFIIFFFSFAIFAKISQIISKSVKSSVVGILDRIVGMIFGFARACIVFSISYMLYSTMTADPGKNLKILENSKTISLIKTSVTFVQIFLPNEVIQSTEKELEGWIDDKVKSATKLNNSPENWPKDNHVTTAQDLAKIDIVPQNTQVKEPDKITHSQKEKLNRILESY